MASEQPAGYVCDGCGRLARDPEQDMQKLREDNFLSCCPERKMLPVYTRPAPAATDTALVRYDLSMFGNGIVEMGGGAYVRADQAEELLAAERAEKRIWMGKAAIEDERVERLEADNAAQAARIKELEQINAVLMGDDEDKPRYTTKRLKHEIARATEALEAKLAAAEQQLRGIVTAWESLPGGRNYSTGEVQDWLLGPMQKAINRIRAVLGGKPS